MKWPLRLWTTVGVTYSRSAIVFSSYKTLHNLIAGSGPSPGQLILSDFTLTTILQNPGFIIGNRDGPKVPHWAPSRNNLKFNGFYHFDPDRCDTVFNHRGSLATSASSTGDGFSAEGESSLTTTTTPRLRTDYDFYDFETEPRDQLQLRDCYDVKPIQEFWSLPLSTLTSVMDQFVPAAYILLTECLPAEYLPAVGPL